MRTDESIKQRYHNWFHQTCETCSFKENSFKECAFKMCERKKKSVNSNIVQIRYRVTNNKTWLFRRKGFAGNGEDDIYSIKFFEK